jgi:hypothetical protein
MADIVDVCRVPYSQPAVWFVREMVRLVVRIVIATIVALALAGILTAISSHSFATSARILCIVFGCMLLAMAGVGSGSNLERYMDRNVTKVAWGTIPGFDSNKRNPEDPTLSPGAVFVGSGVALLAIGIFLF